MRVDNGGQAHVSRAMALEIETEYYAPSFFPNSSFVQVYFEAVANAFDAGATEITIAIVGESPDITISIKDNGCGFKDERFQRFARLMKPVDEYHKGLGRLVYLIYFTDVQITSFFDDKRRSFRFSHKFNGTSKVTDLSETQPGTTLQFNGFTHKRLKSNDDIKPTHVKAELLKQFLPLLHDKKKKGHYFRINITWTPRSQASLELFSNSQSITGDDVPVLECKTVQHTLDAFSTISMYYALREVSGVPSHLIAACIDGRTIPIKQLIKPSAIPAKYSTTFLFESDLFAGRSDSARQRLVLPEHIEEAALHRVLRRALSAVLSGNIQEIAKQNYRTKQYFDDKYPHLTGLFEEDTVGLIDKEEALDDAQRRFFEKQRKVLESESLDDATFSTSLEVSSRTLMEYILYRELIIKKLGASNDERDLHNLIVPRHRTLHGSTLVDDIYNNNAWLLDDKFMTFRTILSEARMQTLIAAITLKEETVKEDGRPDISMIFSADPTHEKADVVVVELKRRGADLDATITAINQLAGRAELLADYCPNIQRIWYFAIVDIDLAIARRLKTFKYIPLFSRGTVFYQEYSVERTVDKGQVPAPIYVLSYDTIIKDAQDRNHTFLALLKSAFKNAQPGEESNPPIDSTVLAPAASDATKADQAAPSAPEPPLPQSK